VTSKFDVDFPMFAKIDVNGDDEAALYSLLKSAQPGEGETPAITWNFEKFLVDKQGNVVRRFPPITTPEDVAAVIPEYL
jgi:glutathione peroxidase